MRGEFLRWTARFEIAIAIGEPNHAVGVSDVQRLGIIPGGIKGDSKRLVQAALSEDFIGVGPAARLRVTQYPNLIGATFHDKDVAVWRGQKKSRITKSAGV